ncbi:MAG TPA: T9SS type A sorting domain-containing protein [Cyclobacteriaceae bacterium]|jgi:hypothetical protein|nr:T9SS type A sorting domain-containing protein [Cyclobacteriaceae bacterium]
MRTTLKVAALLSLLNFCFASTALAQRYAVINGNWTTGIWASTPGGVAGSAATPTALDDVYTNGKNVTISSVVTCKNLAVSQGTTAGLTFTSGSVTVTGTLFGWDDINLIMAGPTVNTLSGSSIFTFTAANWDGLGGTLFDNELISNWNSTAPITRAVINTPNTSTYTIDNDATGNVQFAQLQVTGNSILGSSINNFPISPVGTGIIATTSLSLVSTSSFNCDVPIRGGAAQTALIPNFSNSGQITTSSYINCNTCNVPSTGVIHTSFNGTDQTEGFWYQSARPTGGTISGSIYFEAAANQNVYSRSYGSLILDGSGTKTLVSANTLNISGNLTINSASITFNTNAATAINVGGNISNAGSWTPTDLVSFNGTGAQSVSGSSSINFSGGIDVNKTAGTLTLNKAITVSNGVVISQGTFSLGSQNVTINSGTIDNSNGGTITFTGGSGSTLTVNGAVSMTGSSAFNNVTINSTVGNLTAPSATLSVAGNFANNGTFNANSGTLTFNGTTDQSITGTVNVNNVNISNSGSTASINGNMNLSGVLTVTSSSSSFDADGTGSGVLTVKSTGVSSGGRIAAIPSTGSFADVPITIERYIDSPDNWRYLAMPITTGTANSWKTGGFYVTGNFTNPSTPTDNSNIVDSTSPSIYRWDAPTQAWIEVPSSSGAAQATTSVTLSNNVGYSAYSYNTANSVVSVRGNIARGTVSSIAISNTNGNYNLIPNPHASPIDWDNIQPTVTGLQDQMWIRQTDNSFASYVHGSGVATNGPGGWTGEVAIGQSFWTQSNGAASTISLAQSAKTNNTSQFLRTEAPTNLVRIALNYGTQKDESVIHFVDGATVNYEDGFDAIKRKNGDFDSGTGMNSYVNLSSYNVNSASDFAINAISPLASCSGNIKLKLADTPIGNYSLSFTDLETLSLGYTVTLIDHFLSTTVPINNGDSYSFSVTANALSTGDARFEISTASPSINLVAPTYTIDNKCDPSSIPVSLTTQTGVNYQLFSGATAVGNVLTGTGSQVSLQVPRTALTDGVNSLDVKAFTPDNCSTKTYSGAVSITNKAIPTAPSTTDGSVCTSGNVTLAATGAPTDGSYLWYDKVDASNPLAGATGATFATPSLSTTTSYYVSALNVFGCASVRKEVVANVFVPTIPTITSSSDTLYSSQKTDNQWYKNGQPISGATQRFYVVKESGDYSVQTIDPNGCSGTSDSKVMVVTAIHEENETSSVFPNPTHDLISISWDAANDGALQGIHIFDSRGLTVFSSEDNKAILQADEKTISMGSMSSGLYVLKLVSDKGTRSIKIVKK